MAKIGLWRREADLDDLGTTAWNCHLHPSMRFSGSSNHLIHAFLAVASLGNLCPPKLLHLGTQRTVPRLFLLWLSMPPTATHQQDNSYGKVRYTSHCKTYLSSLFLPFHLHRISNCLDLQQEAQHIIVTGRVGHFYYRGH